MERMTRFLLVSAIVFLMGIPPSALWAGGGNNNEKPLTSGEFEDAIDRIETQLGAIKGDTENLVDAMGVLAEGTLPKGKGLIAYSMEVGWNPWVIAGHNGLKSEELDNLPVGKIFRHPCNKKEMAAALKKGRIIRQEYYKGKAPNIKVAQVIADVVTTRKLEAQVAKIDNLEAERMVVQKANIELAEVNKLVTNDLQAAKAKIGLLEADLIKAEKIEAKKIEAELVVTQKLVADLIEANKIVTKELFAQRAYIEQAQIDRATIGKLENKLETVKQEAQAGNIKGQIAEQRAAAAESYAREVATRTTSPAAASGCELGPSWFEPIILNTNPPPGCKTIRTTVCVVDGFRINYWGSPEVRIDKKASAQKWFSPIGKGTVYNVFLSSPEHAERVLQNPNLRRDLAALKERLDAGKPTPASLGSQVWVDLKEACFTSLK